MKTILSSLFVTLALTLPSVAEPPTVEQVSVRQASDGTWRFDVTIAHPDTGWEHYADAWRVLDMDGNQLAIRELAHPHVNEQPFTRSISGVRLPEGTTQVQVQARDKPGGWNPEMKRVRVP